MITDFGRKAIGKYLAETINSPFEYIALGCGPKPLVASAEPAEPSVQPNNLELESIRIPILETSYQEDVDAGKNYLSLTGTVPSNFRYEFSEIGVYPAERDNAISSPTDYTMFIFSDTDGWKTVDYQGIEEEIKSLTPAGTEAGTFNPDYDENELNEEKVKYKAWYVQSDDLYFVFAGRNYASPRVGPNGLMVRGDMSTIHGSPGSFRIWPISDKVSIDYSVDLSGVRPNDQMVLGISVVPTTPTYDPPDEVQIIVEFKQKVGSPDYARFEIKMIKGIGEGQYDFDTNSYYAVSGQFTPTASDQTFVKSADFSWSNVNVVNIYVDARPTDWLDTVVIVDQVASSVANKRLDKVAHGLVDRQEVVLQEGANPLAGSGLEEGVKYYVVGAQTNDFQLSETSGGTAIVILEDVSDIAVIDYSVGRDNYYIVLDTMRFVSKNDTNPNYGLVAYSLVDNPTASTIVNDDGQERKFEYKIELSS